MQTDCADNFKDGRPICTGRATWSDGSAYETGLVPGLIVEGEHGETGEQVAWDGVVLNDEYVTDLRSTLCEYTCVW